MTLIKGLKKSGHLWMFQKNAAIFAKLLDLVIETYKWFGWLKRSYIFKSKTPVRLFDLPWQNKSQQNSWTHKARPSLRGQLLWDIYYSRFESLPWHYWHLPVRQSNQKWCQIFNMQTLAKFWNTICYCFLSRRKDFK
jgi:hypothetical protein